MTLADIVAAGGGALLVHYRRSPCLAVMDLFPDEDWKEWLFARVPRGFWNSEENVLRWIRWFESERGILGPTGWYRVTTDQIKDSRGGGTVLARLGSSVATVARFRYPDFPWQEWLFRQVPAGFWRRRENQERFLAWVGEQLGYRTQRDWLRLPTQKQIVALGGSALLGLHQGSPLQLVKKVIFGGKAEEWEFRRVSAGFFESRVNRRRYLSWLARELALPSEAHLAAIHSDELRHRHGAPLLRAFEYDIARVLRASLPVGHPALARLVARKPMRRSRRLRLKPRSRT